MGNIRSVEMYDVNRNVWQERSPLPQDRSGAALLLLARTPHLFGGYSEAAGGATGTIFRLNLESNSWEELDERMDVSSEYSHAIAVNTGCDQVRDENGDVVCEESFSLHALAQLFRGRPCRRGFVYSRFRRRCVRVWLRSNKQ